MLKKYGKQRKSTHHHTVVKSISMLPIPLTARGIKSFIGCVIYLGQFLPKLSELIKPINDISQSHSRKTETWPSSEKEGY